MVAPLVVIAIGNPSRGDDALGPHLLAALEAAWGVAPETVTLLEDFQLQIEHALDLVDRRLALFIDAIAAPAQDGAPYQFRRLSPRADWGHSTHALSPEQVLAVYAQTEGEPPPAFVLGVQGVRFELGEALTPAAQAHADAALDLLKALLAAPEAEVWQRYLTD